MPIDSNVTRNSYSLYKRETGSRTIWYARFWNDDTQSYTGSRSTGQTTKPAANRQVQKWLTEGLPGVQRKDLKATKNRLIGAIEKYLEDCEIIKNGENHDTGEIIKLFYTQVTNLQMASGERFVDYLYRFWDWNGDYVQGRLERGKSIGKRYVDGCFTKIKLHIEPFFKDTLLCDITTLLLEQFMRSFPRRDIDPQNGYSKSTINLVMKVIKKPLKEAVRLGILPKNPADSIELLSEDTQERGILTPAELERLFRLEWIDERGKIASILAAVSGMRLGEITALQIDNLDIERKIIHVLHSYTSYEQRLKTTKTGKSRIIYTDSSIIQMLIALHAKNPYEERFIFWGLEPHKPIRAETIEDHLEKAIAALLGEEIQKGITDEWREVAQILISENIIQPGELIAVHKDSLDTSQNIIRLDHSYLLKNRKLEILKYEKEKRITIKTATLQKLSMLLLREPYVFIIGGTEVMKRIDIVNLEENEKIKMSSLLGDIARRERNLSFHGFRHFFNSTIRGTVSDDILRLQTGHLSKEMTDEYDHMTDDRGEQLRKAVQAKILPFIPKAIGE